MKEQLYVIKKTEPGLLWFNENIYLINTMEFIITKVIDHLKFSLNWVILFKDPEFMNKVGMDYIDADNNKRFKIIMDYLNKENDLLWVELLLEDSDYEIYTYEEYMKSVEIGITYIPKCITHKGN